MSDNFPSAPGSTDNNYERSGRRNLTLSSFFRSLPGQRVLDNDGYGYCPDCRKVLWFSEGTGAPNKSWTMTQQLACDISVAREDCCAFLIVHAPCGDEQHEHSIDFHHVSYLNGLPVCESLDEDDLAPTDTGIIHEVGISWQRLYDFLDGLRIAHRCRSS